MTNVDVDLSNYKDRVGARIAAGDYRVIVEDVEVDQSRQGNKMINLWLRVQGGPYEGATIVDRLVLTDKSLFRVVGFMQAIGLPTPRKRLRVNTDLFRGRVLIVNVEDGEPYQGRPPKSEVRGYMRAEVVAAASEPDDLDGLEEFAASEPTNEELAAANGQSNGQAKPVTDTASKGPQGQQGEEADEEFEEIDLDSLDLG